MKKKSIILFVAICALFTSNKVFSGAIFTVTPESSSQLINHLLCEYDFDISGSNIENFLNGVMQNPSSGCGEVIPNHIGSTPSTAEFDWPAVPGAKDYTVSSLGLDDGAISVNVTLATDYTFTNLSNQTYIFFFLTNCLDGTFSTGTIVIIDNDLGILPEENYCICDDPTIVIQNQVCPYSLESYSFPWDENYVQKKYAFYINYFKNGNQYEREFHLSRTVENSIAHLGIYDCSDDYYQYQNIAEIGNEDYNVIFSSSGTHIYIVNNAVTIDTISASHCLMPGENRSSKVSEYQNLEVYPNPFNDEIQIELNDIDAANAIISIYAVNGILQNVNVNDLKESTGKFTINTENLNPGIYNILLDFGTHKINRRILKL